MAPTGIEIFKKLPKTNCGDCGFATCLAFAMNIAAGKAEPEKCPHLSAEAKEFLEAASTPPIRKVTIGSTANNVVAGGETVEFRHDRTFVSPTPIAVLITSDMNDDKISERLASLETHSYERISLVLKAEMAALKDTGAGPKAFAEFVGKVISKKDIPLILISEDADTLAAGAEASGTNRPLLHAATPDNFEKVAETAKRFSCPVVAKADNLDALAELAEKLMAAGIKDIVLDTSARSLSRAFADQIAIRRISLRQLFKPLGFPTIAFPCEMTGDPMMETLAASALVAKYAGIVVLSELKGETLMPLLLARMNIFTDPQRPMAMSQGIYKIGNPDADSPVLLTTNFSLTYFIVSGEVESSRVPAWLLVHDSEGLSVLTAWAAGKFVADTIAPFVKSSGIAEQVGHKKLIVPGYTAVIAPELEEELGDWKVLVGPREASHIPAYLRRWPEL